MTGRDFDPFGVNRRAVLRRLATGAAATLAGGTLVRTALGQDAALAELIKQNQNQDFGQGYDSASRTVTMPKASLPALSPSTVQTTDQAIARYEQIVASGGWPTVPQSEKQLRLGNRQPAVKLLRDRLIASGDLNTSAGVSDVFDSYVEAAVRRFQARRGINVGGIVREQNLAA